MPNIATVLKEEIRRLARKEAKAQVAMLKKASAQQRRDTAGECIQRHPCGCSPGR